MKKYYNLRSNTEMAIRTNLSQVVQNHISSTDPLEIRQRVNGIIEVDGREFENWEEVERYFLNIIEEMEALKNEI